MYIVGDPIVKPSNLCLSTVGHPPPNVMSDSGDSDKDTLNKIHNSMENHCNSSFRITTGRIVKEIVKSADP